jgi:predicted  nucleic acid-binding Zn-ribbon protein
MIVADEVQRMGPTNLALVNYYQADQKVREAEARLDSASRNIRIQERKVHDLEEKLRLTTQTLKQSQAHAMALDLELKSRDAQIEKLREQQQHARNNKEYQSLSMEISTRKADRAKSEDEAMKTLQNNEKLAGEIKDITAHVESERTRLTTMKAEINDRLSAIQAEIDALKPIREEAGSKVPAKAREVFDKMSEKLDGQAMAPIDRPDARREEYVCTSCNMDLVTDIYNKLHSRDELVFCPSCRRILYIPDDLPKTAPKPPARTPRKTAERKPRAAKAKSTPKSSNAAAGAIVSDDPWLTLLMKAQGESVRNAMAAGNEPREFEVRVDGKALGSFKGQTRENLERVIRFFVAEMGMAGDVQVVDQLNGGSAETPILSETELVSPDDSSDGAEPSDKASAPSA